MLYSSTALDFCTMMTQLWKRTETSSLVLVMVGKKRHFSTFRHFSATGFQGVAKVWTPPNIASHVCLKQVLFCSLALLDRARKLCCEESGGM